MVTSVIEKNQTSAVDTLFYDYVQQHVLHKPRNQPLHLGKMPMLKTPSHGHMVL